MVSGMTPTSLLPVPSGSATVQLAGIGLGGRTTVGDSKVLVANGVENGRGSGSGYLYNGSSELRDLRLPYGENLWLLLSAVTGGLAAEVEESRRQREDMPVTGAASLGLGSCKNSESLVPLA